METKKRGSAILMILIVITTIGIIAAYSLKINGLVGQLVIERAHYHAKRAALDALAFYGIAMGYTHSYASENQSSILKTFEAWPVGNTPYQGVVSIVHEGKGWRVHAELGQNKQFLDKIIACASPTTTGWEISQWDYVLG